MTIQQQCAERIYELLPELNRVPKDLPLPVRYDGMSYYWGKDGEMVADFDEGVNTGDGFRIRGWGRIQDEKSQDECAKYIEQAINSYSKIGIAEVLRVFLKRGCGVRIELDFSALVPCVNFMTHTDGCLNRWNLSTDNILSQSNECCEFLLKLLK